MRNIGFRKIRKISFVKINSRYQNLENSFKNAQLDASQISSSDLFYKRIFNSNHANIVNLLHSNNPFEILYSFVSIVAR